MRVFVQGVDGFVGGAVRRLLAREAAAEAEAGEEGKACEVEVVGSAAGPRAAGCREVAPHADVEAVCRLARSAQRVVLDTHASVREASAIVKALKQPFEGSKSVVLVSTLLAWDRTPAPAREEGDEGKEASAEGAGVPTFSESEFHRRKPSAAFLLHKTLESQVLALAHEQLSTTVVAAGVMYGAEELHLHAFFRDAWLGRGAVLPALNEGCKNVVPMVHVEDVARCVCAALKQAPSQQYVVLADDSRSTVAEVVTAVFSVLQPHAELTLAAAAAPAAGEEGAEQLEAWQQFKAVPAVASAAESDAILLKDDAWAFLQANLAFEESATVGELVPEWTSKEGLVANVHKVVAEFKRARDLRPVRLAVLGAPLAGKTSLAQRLAAEYSLPLVSARSALKELLAGLETTRAERSRRLAQLAADKARARAKEATARAAEGAGGSEEESKEAAEGEGEGESEEDAAAAAALRVKGTAERLAERVEKCIEAKGRASGKLSVLALRAKLLSPNCLNHGYVLDASEPWTFAALQRVFCESAVAEAIPQDAPEGEPAPSEDFDELTPFQPAEGAAADGSDLPVDRRVWPSGVVVVSARDETLRARAKAAEGAAARSAQEFEQELALFKKLNADSLLCTPLSFFEGACKLDSLAFASEPASQPSQPSQPQQQQQQQQQAPQDEQKQGGNAEDEAWCNLKLYADKGGRPFNYHPTAEELQIAALRKKQSAVAREEEARKQRVLAEQRRKEGDEERTKALEAHRESVDKHEADLLDARAEPLKAYLLKHVMPTLSKGLVETCRVKPADPIDFLAEYLFKNSAETE